jgi:serine-threonine kinase receptor-associated protein
VGGQDKLLRIFDLSRIDAGPTHEFVHPKGVRKALWRHNDGGKTIITGSEDGLLRLWDVATGTVVKELVAASDSAPVMDMELHSALNTLIVAAGKEVLLLDATTLDVRKRFAYRYLVECAALHPRTGSHFVAGGSDVHVHCYNAETGEEVHTERGHHGAVHCVRFHPDGNSFSSGADDATIRMWKFDPAGWAASPAGKLPSPLATA